MIPGDSEDIEMNLGVGYFSYEVSVLMYKLG